MPQGLPGWTGPSFPRWLLVSLVCPGLGTLLPLPLRLPCAFCPPHPSWPGPTQPQGAPSPPPPPRVSVLEGVVFSPTSVPACRLELPRHAVAFILTTFPLSRLAPVLGTGLKANFCALVFPEGIVQFYLFSFRKALVSVETSSSCPACSCSLVVSQFILFFFLTQVNSVLRKL